MKILKKTFPLKAEIKPVANKSLINGYFMFITNNIVRTIPSVKPKSFKTRKILIEFTLGMHLLAILNAYTGICVFICASVCVCVCGKT